jgi:hypothetical protein
MVTPDKIDRSDYKTLNVTSTNTDSSNHYSTFVNLQEIFTTPSIFNHSYPL